MRQVGDFNPSQEYEKSISPIESRGIPKSQKKTKVETMSPIYYFLDLVLYYLSILHTPWPPRDSVNETWRAQVWRILMAYQVPSNRPVDDCSFSTSTRGILVKHFDFIFLRARMSCEVYREGTVAGMEFAQIFYQQKGRWGRCCWHPTAPEGDWRGRCARSAKESLQLCKGKFYGQVLEGRVVWTYRDRHDLFSAPKLSEKVARRETAVSVQLDMPWNFLCQHW